MKRRQLLVSAAGLPLALQLRPAQATPEALAAAIRNFTGGAPLREGKLLIEVATLVDNGNTVPVSVSVPGAAPAEVAAVALFNERNPHSDVVRVHFGPRAGLRTVSTRIRLATSQQLVAVARLADGSCWVQRVDVLVTLAACIE